MSLCASHAFIINDSCEEGALFLVVSKEGYSIRAHQLRHGPNPVDGGGEKGTGASFQEFWRAGDGGGWDVKFLRMRRRWGNLVSGEGLCALLLPGFH